MVVACLTIDRGTFVRVRNFSVDEKLRKCSLNLSYSIICLSHFIGIQVVAGLTIVVEDMLMHQAHRNLVYAPMWWPQYVAHTRNLLAPYHVIYIDASNWIHAGLFFYDPLYILAQGTAQFRPYFDSLPILDTENLAAHSAASSAQGSVGL
jgi:hypothetical protein